MYDGIYIKPSFEIPEIEKIYGSSFTGGNSVHLLWKNGELFKAIFDYIAGAERFVCLEFYIFRNDETGIELAELLKKKAAEGVCIYILYDHFGSFGTPRKFWAELKKAGINVRASHPFKWTAPLHYVHRDHKKLILIDGEKAFTGGLNIANEYRGYYFKRHKEAWRDTGILLEGPIAGTLLNEFKKSWLLWGGKPLEAEVKSEESELLTSNLAIGLPVLSIFASSSRGRRRLRRLLYYSINHARKSIFLTTAYFTPSRRMINILSGAVKRGAAVRLLLPLKSDVLAADYAGKASFTELLKAGVQIYNYKDRILHAKTAVFDGCWSIIGSANLDFQSLRWNDEGNVGILDKKFGQKMIDVFEEDIKSSARIELEEWIKRNFCEKIKERFFALFRRRL
ncbi:MAG: phospholipase D-like domain-containing protein [Thermodesulfovibrionales bacterium]|nr:phospholipase D-like domain-containing protein [Thermodesulfovibrionales bacterium]